ncbi:hypothetical protein HPB52_021916 [Rhipicephalus sanguineus]|uniref:Uncharacterized protein n=1 Tax=Rhipicephalus sanguineus TaxID=34632 RepID=A0A9D4PXY1_RHISA|nr:hypothetical protein HPB52_021916 [Rhipicephalus sanguineus]
MCGGNDALDARAVTAALNHIVKEKALPSIDMGIRDENIEEDDVIEELKALREPARKPPNSVAYSGLVYVDGYIAKLITDVGCETCAMLVTANKTSSPLYHLLRQQEAYDLHYPKPELLSMLDTIVMFFEKAVKYIPRTKILETLQLTVEPYLEDSPLLDCPEDRLKSCTDGQRTLSVELEGHVLDDQVAEDCVSVAEYEDNAAAALSLLCYRTEELKASASVIHDSAVTNDVANEGTATAGSRALGDQMRHGLVAALVF